jgi:hypothetical protein
MTFTHCDDYRHMFEDIKRRQVDENRYYEVSEDIMYPSVTSVISFITAPRIAKWRARVGLEEANRKSKHACTRGTRLHKVIEVYMQNGDYKSLPEWKIPLIQMMFQSAKFRLDTRLDNIYQQETPMSSDRLCLAGTVDLICEVDGELSIVDFKTSEKEKPEEWLEDYFVQLSAYWAMFSEKTGFVPKKLVVFLVGENGDVQIVERRNIMKYLMTLREYASQFIEHRDARTK